MSKPLPESLKKIGFWKHVLKTDACWLWTGHRIKGGYGQASYNGKTIAAHRVSWIKFNGKIPNGLLVLHKCDIRNCVNPEHLFLGTYKDNMDDMYKKGRGPTGDKNGSRTKPHRRAWGDRNGSRTHPEKRPRGDNHWMRKYPEKCPRGENNPHSHLTEKSVKKIIKLYSNGKHTQDELSKIFNVSQAHISRIILRRAWNHLVE